ncbi:DMT family transporter [Neiella sp. HB171785]|uniref:DMT family transporter n=1 Tax=Neiella litorisoli TaxID=2771431 RepID=A0A8J6QTM3_9GAMM|nr:DMT family transporter [Neiella litorisoli]MBD1388078.1 DMT family transporter [Neiella litorisoli]
MTTDTCTDKPPPSMARPNRSALLGSLLCVASAALFSSKAISIKLAFQYGVDATTLLALRMAFTLPFSLVILWLQWSRRKSQAHHLCSKKGLAVIGIGVLGYFIASLLDFIGLSYISAQLERVVLFSYPLLVVLLGCSLFGMTFHRPLLWTIPCCWLGIAISMWSELSINSEGTLTGVLLVLASAVCFAFYTLCSKHMIQWFGAGIFSSLVMSAASAVALVYYAVTADLVTLLEQPMAVYGHAVYMAIMATVIPGYLFSESIRRIGADQASVTSSVGPVSTAIMAYLILNEPFGWGQAIGLLMVTASVLWLTLNQRAKA